MPGSTAASPARQGSVQLCLRARRPISTARDCPRSHGSPNAHVPCNRRSTRAAGGALRWRTDGSRNDGGEARRSKSNSARSASPIWRCGDSIRAALLRRTRAPSAARPATVSRAPLVLDLSHLPDTARCRTARALLDARRAAPACCRSDLSYGTAENEQLAQTLNLPLFAKFRASTSRTRPGASCSRPGAAQRRSSPAPRRAHGPAPFKPVRSGQQVYARGRDLIVATVVGNGAEVIADGSIHVYGRLARTRARWRARRHDSAHLLSGFSRRARLDRRTLSRVLEDMPAEFARPGLSGLARWGTSGDGKAMNRESENDDRNAEAEHSGDGMQETGASPSPTPDARLPPPSCSNWSREID